MEMVKMVPAICTQCNAALEIDPSKDAAICPYCGTPFVVEKAVERYKAKYHIEHAEIHVQGLGASIANTIKNHQDNLHKERMMKLEAEAEEQRRKREEEEYYRTPEGRAEERFYMIILLGMTVLAWGGFILFALTH